MRIYEKKLKEKLIDFEKKHPLIPFLGTASIILIIIVLIIGICYIRKSIIYDEPLVQFADQEFGKAIQKELRKSNIYQSDMDSITTLELDGNQDIINIKDIVKCRNLVELSITNCSISDISPIGELQYIQSVNFTGNSIMSLDRLQEADTLTEIVLDNNYISDLEVLGSMRQIESLSLANNNVSRLPDNLNNLINLFYLDLSGNRLIDITDLNGMTNLNILNVSANKLSNSPEMNNLPQLQSLDLSNNTFLELDTLGNLPQLEELYVSKNYLNSLKFLEQYPKIKKLDISYNEFTSLDGILECVGLEYLDIRGTQIKDVSCLQQLEFFNSIYVDENFNREQLVFMAEHFRNCDVNTKKFLLKRRYNLS